MAITVLSTSVADVGIHYIGLIASLVSYPTISQTLPFTVIISNCLLTSIAVATGAFNSALTTNVNIFDATGLQLAIPTFTQTPACGFTPSYSLLADTIPISGNGFTSQAFLSSSSSMIQVQTSDLSLNGKQYTIQLQTTIGSLVDTQTTKVAFLNPCLTTTWNANSLTPMTATVLNPTPVVQTFSACSVVATGCGSIQYQLNQTQSFLAFDEPTMTISVLSTSVADVGIHYIGLIASLVTYPTNSQTLPFTITISNCVVTSLTLISGAFDPALMNTVNIFDSVGLQLAIPTYTQTPACSLSPTYVLSASISTSSPFTSQPFFTQLSPTMVQVVTSDTTLSGSDYIIQLQTIIGTQSDVQTTQVYFNNPCNTVGWNVNSVASITTSVNVSPSLTPQVFSASSVTNTNCGPVSYALNQTLSFVTLNPAALTITVVSTSSTDEGVYYMGLVATLTNYPSIQQTLPFLVTIQNCVVIGIAVNSGAWSPTQIQTVNILDTTGLLISIPTYSQTPACGYPANYGLTAESVLSTGFIAQTFFTQQSTTTLQVKTSDTSLNGQTYTLKLETTIGAITNTQTTKVVFTDPCLTASFNANALSNMTTSVNVSPTLAPQSITPSTVNVPATLTCGVISYSLNSSLSFITLDTIAMTITVIATSASQAGTYPLQLQATVIGYSNIVQNLAFTVFINPCQVTSISVFSGALSPTLVSTVKVYDPVGYQSSITTFSQTPACGYIPVYTFTGDTVPSTGYVTQPWLTQLGTTTFQVQTNDYTLDSKQFSVRQFTTIGTLTNSQTTQVVFSDPCKTTSFISQVIANTFTFISSALSPATVILPILADTVNSTYPSGSSVSTCHGQLITVTYAGLPISFLTQSVTSTGNTNLTFVSSSPSNVGTYQIDCLYTLTRYPTIKTTISFDLTFYLVTVPPAIQNQTYTIGNSPLTFSMGVISISPSLSSNFVITYQSSLSPSGSLPSFIVGSSSTSGYQYTVTSTNNPVAGTYNIVLTTTITDSITTKSQSVSQSVQILVVAAKPVVTVLSPPTFGTPVTTSFQINAGDPWTYSLPPYSDPQGLDVVLSVQLGSAGIFTSFSAGVFNIPASTTTNQNVANYTFTVLLNNTLGANSRTTIQLSILAAQQITQSNTTTPTNTSASTNSPSVLPTDNTTVLPPSTPPQSAEQQAQAAAQQAQVEAAVATASPEAKQAMSMLQQTTSSGSTQSDQSSGTGFNWAAAFAAVLLKQKSQPDTKVILNPDVKITSISKTGLVTLTFNKTITVSPLQMIQTATVYNATLKQKIPALFVSILPGKSSNPGNLTMKYNITSFQPTRLQIQIDFDDSSYVSQFSDPDQVKVEFIGYFYFFDSDGLMIANGKTLTGPFPKQLGQKTAVTATTAAVGQATNAVMAGNFIAQLLLSGSLSQLWSMINTQQIIVLMPLFKVNLPKNAAIFFGFIMQLAAFQVIPVQSLYNVYLPAPDTDGPISDNFNSVGFQSMYFLQNMGSMILGILSIFILLVVYWTSQILQKKWKIFNKLAEKLSNHLFWSSQITMLFETLSMVSICVFINLTIITFDSLNCLVNSSLTIAFLVACTVLPFLILIFMLVKFPVLNDLSMRKKFGELYHNLDLRQGRITALVPFIFLIRRYLLGAVVVFSDKLIYQIIVLLAGVMSQVVCIGEHVYLESSTAINEVFNEFVITTTLYTMICFTDWIPDKKTQENVGYLACLLVCTHLFVNLFQMFTTSFKKAVLKIKRWQNHKKSKQNRILTQTRGTLKQTTLAIQNLPSEVQNNAQAGDQYSHLKRRKPIVSKNGYVQTTPSQINQIDWSEPPKSEFVNQQEDKPKLPVMKRRHLAPSMQASFQLEMKQNPQSDNNKPGHIKNESLTDAIARLFPLTQQRYQTQAVKNNQNVNANAVQSRNIQNIFYKTPIKSQAQLASDLEIHN